MVFLFAFISIFLLLPFLWFMKLGISKKGKIIIILCSFFISILALLTLSNYPIWQSVLIGLLLIASITYLLNIRFKNLIFEASPSNSVLGRESLYFELSDESDETSDKFFDFHRDEELLIKEVIEEALETTSELIAEIEEPTENPDSEEAEYNIDKIKDSHKEDLIELHDFGIDKLILEEIELPKKEVTQEETPLVDFFNEIKELSPDLFSEINVEEEAKIEYDEDEIIPLKEFDLEPREKSASLNKNKPVNRKNYLSEIEKLLEES